MGRFHCPGSNVEPLPTDSSEGYTELVATTVVTEAGGTVRTYHHPMYGMCPECHDLKRLLKSGLLPKHDRYLSYKEQIALGLR